MLLSPSLRKATLLAHIVSSVGWIGAVAAFLALALTGIRNPDPLTVRAVYLAMEPVTQFIIVPSAFAALFTGLVLSLGTQWGLVRHYWIIVKLIINVISIALLLLHTRVIHQVAQAAGTASLSPSDLPGPRMQLVYVSILALAALLIAALLSVYKPRGVTPYRRWKQ